MIRNYLGFPLGISGRTLTTLARGQALLFGAELVFDRATGLRTHDTQHLVRLAHGNETPGTPSYSASACGSAGWTPPASKACSAPASSTAPPCARQKPSGANR
ncbi:hypothetical protein ACPPVO_43290 [Dactylosporangium sp. McL0621]|uniref:hypothetical protein n=1 Tax=Dactylosporangium sp. McL0621 TaxID=3415678 RepID=UPI003CED2B3C